MRIKITEEQYKNIILVESENDAFDRKNANEKNLKAIWAAIDRKQQLLKKEVFGELGDKIHDITLEKVKQMNNIKPNVDFMDVPRNMFTAGNDKLPPSVLVVNMSSALMCPSYFLGLCTITKGACYAMRDENQYSRVDSGSVLKNNWQRDILNTQMLQQYQHGNKNPMKEYFRLIEHYIQLGNAYSENLFKRELERMRHRLGRELDEKELTFLRIQQSDTKITDVRLNESGDFQCQLAVDLWTKFAKKLKKKYGINTHAYTARNLDFSKASEVMSINFSHPGNNPRGNVSRRFQAIDDRKWDKLVGGDEVKNGQPILGKTESGIYFYKCPCSKKETKCDRCGVCFNKNKTNVPYVIYVKYHGTPAANGLKNLFKKSEVDGVIDRLYSNGWITKEEYQSSKNPDTITKLNNYSDKVEAKRKETTTKKSKKVAKK